MAKVSIGLRGWRFDESDVFTDAGTFRPFDEMPDEVRERLARLAGLVGTPCDACYLLHGDRTDRQNEATIVYGEPGDELLLCDTHEPDFLYWYREEGGRDLRGTEAFRDAFHEWFVGGGRAPEGYAGIDHVDTDPDAVPDPPTPDEVEERRIDLLQDDRVDEEDAVTEEDLADLDLDTEYPD